MLRSIDLHNTEELDWLEFAITRTGPTQRHCALIYRVDEGGDFCLLHLAWNYRLEVEDLSEEYQWAKVALPSSEKKFVAALCRNIASQNPPIPYGLDAEGFSFDPTTGVLTPGPTGKGCTCATFILKILGARGYTLLVEEEWPEGANIEWQEHIIRMLENPQGRSPAPADVIDAIKRDVGCRRFMPEEVVAAGTSEDWPIAFVRAQQLAAELLCELRV